MAKVLDSLQLPIKKNGTAAAETYVNNPKAIAGQFSASTAYAAGDYVFYNKVLYRFTAAHAAGAWIGTDAVAATIGEELTHLKADLTYSNKENGLAVLPGTYTVGTTLFTALDVAPNNKIFYKFTATSGTTGYIEIFDANDQRITYFGKGSSSSGALEYEGDYLLPSNYSYAKANGTGSISIDYVKTEVSNSALHGKTDDISSAVDVTTMPIRTLTVIAQKETGTETLPEGFTTGQGYIRNMTVSNPGSISSNTNSRWFAFFADNEMDVYIALDKSDVGSWRNICVYTSAGANTANRITPVYSSNSEDYPLPTEQTPIHVRAGQCVAFSFYNTTLSLSQIPFVIYRFDITGYKLNENLHLTETMKVEVDDKIQGYLTNGYYKLYSDKFARNGWNNNGTSVDSRDYRVRYTDTLTVDAPCMVIMEKGFTIAGYADGVFFDSVTFKRLLPNVEYKIYVRRFAEDSSEVADVNTFANALKISTALAPVELYSPTFADVSMFERMGVCGDSYASGGGIISGVTALTWGKNLERQAGITVDIYAKSGQNVVQWVQDVTHGLPALLAGTECGLYWLQHGINGTSTPEKLGTEADITANPHPATFYGQYTEAIEQIKTTFPKARIIMASIIGSSYGLYQSTYADVNTAIQKIAEYCEVMYVDVTEDDFYRSVYYSQWIRSNHPTAMQCAGIAMANRRLISKCIQDNGDYFVTYGT